MLTFTAHRKPIYDLAFAADGQHLATSGGDEMVRLWSLAPLVEVHEWPGSRVWSPLALSPDGRWLANGGYGVRVWALREDAPPIIASDQFTEAVAFAPDSKTVTAHGNSSRELKRWALTGAKLLTGGWGGTRESTGGDQFPCGAMSFDPAGKLLATVFGVHGKRGYDSVLYLWDAKTGKLKHTLRAGYTAAHPTAVAFSPDGKLLAAGYGPWMRVWDVAAGSVIATWMKGRKHIKGVRFTPDGRRLVTVGGDDSALFYETRTWKGVSAFKSPIGKLVALAASPADKRLAAGSATGKIVVW